MATTKKELISALAAHPGVSATSKDTGDVLDAMPTVLAHALRSTGEVKLPGVGTFKLKQTAPRTGRNPATGAVIEIPAGEKVTFKAAAGLI